MAGAILPEFRFSTAESYLLTTMKNAGVDWMISSLDLFKNNAVSAAYEGSQKDRIVSIQFPEFGLRARKVISRSNARATGKWPSWKTHRMMHYESDNEGIAFKLLDACPEVMTYSEQPCVIHYLMNEDLHRHFPDVLVKFWGHQELWEVKTAEESKSPEVVQRSRLMAMCLPKFGYQYQLINVENLKNTFQLKVLDHVLKLGRQKVTLIELEQIRQLFLRSNSVPWSYFQYGAPGGAYKKQICRLMLEGVLEQDKTGTFEGTTELRYNHGKGGMPWL